MNSRAERRQRREERRKRRATESLSIPTRVARPPDNDPLEIFDRNKEATNHVLRNQWWPSAAFLVCGGPSLNDVDVGAFRQRGIVSLAINNAAGFAPVTAMTFTDPPTKFHHGVFLDPSIIKFVPNSPRRKRRIRAKVADGEWRVTSFEARDCPNVFLYSKNAHFEPEKFFDTPSANYGNNSNACKVNNRPHRLFTMLIGLRLLHYLGCFRVYLVGVDFKMEEGRTYAFDPGRHQGAIDGNNTAYRIVSGMFRELKTVFDARQFEVYNTNPESRLEVFDYVPFDHAVADCRGLVPDEPFDLVGWYDK